jgi:hypothetical protein
VVEHLIAQRLGATSDDINVGFARATRPHVLAMSCNAVGYHAAVGRFKLPASNWTKIDMAKKKNSFTPDLFKFIDSLVVLRHYHFFVTCQLKRARESSERELESVKQIAAEDDYLTGSAVIIKNVFAEGQPGSQVGVGGRITKGREVIQLADEMERRFSAFVLVSMFELVEDLLKSMYGRLLYQLRHEIAVPHEKKFYRLIDEDWKKRKGTLPYYQYYARHVCRQTSKGALSAFKKHLNWPDQRGWFGLDFEELLNIVGFCRNCIVHSGGAIDVDRLRLLSKAQVRFVRDCEHKSLHGKTGLILPPGNLVEECIEAFGGYGWALYSLLAVRCGMSDESGYFRTN